MMEKMIAKLRKFFVLVSFQLEKSTATNKKLLMLSQKKLTHDVKLFNYERESKPIEREIKKSHDNSGISIDKPHTQQIICNSNRKISKHELMKILLSRSGVWLQKHPTQFLFWRSNNVEILSDAQRQMPKVKAENAENNFKKKKSELSKLLTNIQQEILVIRKSITDTKLATARLFLKVCIS
jgi:hypothetical protein